MVDRDTVHLSMIWVVVSGGQDRLRAYAKQYVEQHNSMNGFSGDEPLPPNVIFEGVVKF